jgi:hypothetical protein
MKTAILTKLAKVEKMADDLNHALWCERFTTPATTAMAEKALAATVEKAERCRRALNMRYGVDV